MEVVEVGARPAHDQDRADIELLRSEAASSLPDARGGPMLLGRHGSYDISDRRPDRLVVVGTIDDAVVGYGLVVLVSLQPSGAVADIVELYVTAEGRGVGVGEAMMDEITRWATTHGCVGIDSVALPGDRDTKNFFETFGLVARAIVVHRSLDP